MAGITLTHVPCTGNQPCGDSLMGGHVFQYGALFLHPKSHALRPIAVYEKERLREFPDVPTFSELGYPVVCSNWYGILAPKRVLGCGTANQTIRYPRSSFFDFRLSSRGK